MKYIERKKSILTGNSNLEHLFLFRDFPVFMGCTDEPVGRDIKADMSFSICKDTGIIQLDRLLPLDIVYQNQHNDGVGKIWTEHYLAFSNFLQKFNPKRVLEIGGANDCIAKNFLEKNPDSSWIVVEPHPLFEENKKIKIIKKWFNDDFDMDDKIDTIIHSHVLEHTYDPVSFVKNISKFLKENEMHIFTFPNMIEQLSKKYTNCLNFEHTVFLAEPFVEYILKSNGFKILEKEYFQDHSIFYATEKIKDADMVAIDFPKKYDEYRELFNDFIEYHEKLVNDINSDIKDFSGSVFLFGAHIFSQYLLEFGLIEDRISGVLDNSDLKNKKRLYGTKLMVEKPNVIEDIRKVAVIVKIGAYKDEVLSQLKKIKPDVIIIE